MNETPLFIDFGEGLVSSWEIWNKSPDICQSPLQSSKLSKTLWRLNLLGSANFLWVEVDSFGCDDKCQEFTAGYPQEGFGRIHLQLMRPHDIEYRLQICYVIIFGTIFYCNIVYIAFHCFAYMLVENCIHSSLVCCPRVLQSERHNSITIYPQWRPERCMLVIFKVHLNLIVSRESIHERHPFKSTRVFNHNICDWKGELIFSTCLI